ncbi:hypothetical protein SLEP1_g22272 [Rubroshorea leprosula]|uniref:RNase H type-1 domain-containing protein n=1 Tax=Rubroshorea leprosula TaxID=152421 RepID=A0AAV5JHY3_9ROSI|nr:hypothetical protein SLEP1_g22272 [Rubroshorea leprosula]
MILQHAKYIELAMTLLRLANTQLPQWVRWIPPTEGFYKLSSNGSHKSMNGVANAQVLIRYSLGHKIVGFMVNIGHASILIAKPWGMKAGLHLCHELGITKVVAEITKVVAEMNSLIAIHFVHEGRELDNLVAPLLSNIRSLMTKLESCILQHTLQEVNAAVDFLASLGHSSPLGLCILDSLPNGLQPILLGDQNGASFLRT